DKHLVMIGDSNPNYEFLRPLFSKCSSSIFSSEHVECILHYLKNNENGNKDLEDSSANLLLAIVRNFPAMLKGLEKQFQKLLEQKSPVNDKLIEVIAKAGPHMSFNHRYLVFSLCSDIYPFLKRICLDGTRRQAKFAGSAIAALSSEQSVFRELYEIVTLLEKNYDRDITISFVKSNDQLTYFTKSLRGCQIVYLCIKLDEYLSWSVRTSKHELIDYLYSERNVPTILQSLGCIAQYSVSNFETRCEEITSYICQKIIQMEHLDDGHDATSFHDTSQCSDFCQLKVYKSDHSQIFLVEAYNHQVAWVSSMLHPFTGFRVRGSLPCEALHNFCPTSGLNEERGHPFHPGSYRMKLISLACTSFEALGIEPATSFEALGIEPI
ncbi:hypothetical protein CR513_27556, partial [Mucuna pruriens]